MPETIPVVFRKDGDEIVAVFPTLPGTSWSDMTCYAHVGQHGSCCFGWYNTTKPAKPKEYADLLAELTQIYDDCKLVVRKRIARTAARYRSNA